MRSNDIIWGASAVNIFNYTFMLEYFSAIMGMEVGNYYHITNNIHFYEDKRKLVEQIASVDSVTDTPYVYRKTFNSLASFDSYVAWLNEEEAKMRNQTENYKYQAIEDDFFQDWYNVLYRKNLKKEVVFINPELNQL